MKTAGFITRQPSTFFFVLILSVPELVQGNMNMKPYETQKDLVENWVSMAFLIFSAPVTSSFPPDCGLTIKDGSQAIVQHSVLRDALVRELGARKFSQISTDLHKSQQMRLND